ncbi:MAG TPA: UvrD-helicase domain-containing protein [Candidatus Faecisoma merdavium]|nr:UvrD-helicase domain-containing protein [Candidatus Faecisoma merdavium]
MNLDTLNDRQKEAVNITDGPLLVLAGAGSGKTKVLTTKVAKLIIDNKIDPSNILAITFTNKAAKEMKQRILSMVGDIGYKIQISTFHSFGLNILKKHYDKLKLSKNFTILDSDDSSILIKNILKDMNSDENYKAIKNIISNNKNALIDSYEYERFVSNDFEELVLEVYRKYENRLIKNNSVDFDDLLMLPIVLFKKHPDILKEYQEQYKYILIDEYQDTNEAQYLLTKMISAKYKNICVVGDDSQSIYSWRGSNYKNILNFEKDYPNCKTVFLEQNYRSTKTIINASNDLIKNNINRKDKNLWTDNEEGIKIEYKRAIDEKDEAYYVVSEINKLLDNGSKLSDIAILYRTNAQSRNLEDELLLNNIPYKVVGSVYFYNRKEIKDLMAYLKLIYNKDDDVSLTRIINVPRRKIGKVTIDRLVSKANDLNCSIYDAIDSGKELEFKEIIEFLRENKDNYTLTNFIDLVLEKTGIIKELEDENTIEAQTRIENLNEFKSIAYQFEEKYGIISLEEFLNEISLVSDITEYKDNEAITLMTIHSAKGLEFNNVFIVGLEESIFPHFNSFESNDSLEEERRLCYVAITRAKKRLWLVNALSRTIYGNKVSNKESRFIKEIDSKYFNIKTSNVKVNNVDDSIEYKVGEHIYFDTYGEGVIVGIKDKILTVAFKHPYGIKMLIKGHKKIRKV